MIFLANQNDRAARISRLPRIEETNRLTGERVAIKAIQKLKCDSAAIRSEIEILRRVGCPRELRVQLAQGGAPWLRLAGSRWWDRVVAAGFFLEDSDPGLSGGSWHDVGDGLRWVDPWGCASALRDEVDGVLGPARVEFWPWRGAHGLEPVAEEAEPRRRASAGARARARGRGPAAVGA